MHELLSSPSLTALSLDFSLDICVPDLPLPSSSTVRHLSECPSAATKYSDSLQTPSSLSGCVDGAGEEDDSHWGISAYIYAPPRCRYEM